MRLARCACASPLCAARSVRRALRAQHGLGNNQGFYKIHKSAAASRPSQRQDIHGHKNSPRGGGGGRRPRRQRRPAKTAKLCHTANNHSKALEIINDHHSSITTTTPLHLPAVLRTNDVDEFGVLRLVQARRQQGDAPRRAGLFLLLLSMWRRRLR